MATATLKSITGVTDPIKELTSKAEEAGRKEEEARSAVQKLELGKAESEAKRTAEQAAAKVAGTEEAMARQTARETPIKEQKSEIDNALMNEHFKPSKENLQDQAALFSLINVIGFAIGAGGKQNSMQAMHAMNGMLEGHQKGRGDLFKEEQVKFEKNFKALQQKANFLESELRHSLEEFTRDKRAADERAAAAFASSGADFMKQYAEKYGLVEAHKRAVEVKRSADKAVADYQKEQQRKLDKIETDRKHQEVIRETRALRAPVETPEDKRIAKMGTAGPQYTIYQQTGKQVPDAKTARDVQSAAQGVRAIEGLQEDLRDKEVRTGLTSKAASLFEKIASLDNQDFESAVNSQLTGVDKTTLFLKNALLTSYAIERAAAGGNRLTVQMMKQAGPVLDPTNYKPETYDKLLDNRRRELYDTLHDYGFDSKDVKKMTTRGAYTPYGVETAAPAPAASSGIDTERKNAKAAIEAGAPENKVRERFKQKTGQEL
jgi:hypothetical protein